MRGRKERNVGLWILAASLVAGVSIFAFNFDSLVALITHPEELLEQAKKSVSQPDLPPKPAGQVVQTTEKRFLTIQVPCFRSPFSVRTCDAKLAQDVPVTKTVDPSDQELSDWEKKVAAIREEYQQKIEQEVQRLAADKIKLFRDSAQAWLQLIATLVAINVGFVTIFLGIRKERRETRSAVSGIPISEIEELKAVIDKHVKPRELSAEQIDTIRRHLAGWATHKIRILFDHPNNEANKFAFQICKTFERAGWSVRLEQMDQDTPPTEGLALDILWPIGKEGSQMATEVENIIRRGFEEGGMEFERSGGSASRDMREIDIRLLVGKRPTR